MTLVQRQGMPLILKERMSLIRIRAWYEHYKGNVYVAFSGGKDSTVLLHLVRSLYPDVPAVFVNTGLEFPEIVRFVRSVPNVVTLRPRMSFRAVLERYGYPVVSKEQAKYIHEIRVTKSIHVLNRRLKGISKEGKDCRHFMLCHRWRYLLDAPFLIGSACCRVMKKDPARRYEKESGRRPYLGTLAVESRQRTSNYVTYGCNAYGLSKSPRSAPLSFWLESDIWDYVKLHDVSYSPIYDMGYNRTGCVFCAFGVHLQQSDDTHRNRFELLAMTHPKLHKYCMVDLGMGRVLDYMNVPY